MDISLVSGVVGSLKTAIEIGKTVKEISDLTQVRDKVIEMQDIILSAQSSAMVAQSQIYELLHENAELKQQVSAVDEWGQISSRYQLVDYGSGTFAYSIRPECRGDDPVHRLCTTCFSKRIKSIIHFRHRSSVGQDVYRCVPCNEELFFGSTNRNS